MSIAVIILWFSVLSPLCPIWTGRKDKSILWYYALACLVFDINSLVLKAFQIERLWTSNLFFLAEFILISSYFNQYVFEKKYKKRTIIVLILIAVYFVIDTILNSVLKPNYIDAAILYCLYILFSIFGLYRVMKTIEFLSIEKSPLFIFCIAFLIYASGSFIIFLFEYEVLQIDKAFISAMWQFVRNPMNILKNLLIGYGFVLMNKKVQVPK
jgi:hypothetical protein